MTLAYTLEGNGNPLQYSCLENPMDRGAWKGAVHGVAKSQTQLSDFTFTFHFHALVKEMATHSSVLAWRIPGTGEPGGLLSVGSHRARYDWSDLAAAAAAAYTLLQCRAVPCYYKIVPKLRAKLLILSTWKDTVKRSSQSLVHGAKTQMDTDLIQLRAVRFLGEDLNLAVVCWSWVSGGLGSPSFSMQLYSVAVAGTFVAVVKDMHFQVFDGARFAHCLSKFAALVC